MEYENEIIGIYSESDIEDFLENDEISDEHEGFMRGYLAA